MKKLLYDFVQNKQSSRLMFGFLTILAMMSNHLLPSSASNEAKDLTQYAVLGIVLLWAVIYNLVPKEETLEQVKSKRNQIVWVILMIVAAFLLVQLYEHFYFYSKVNATEQKYRVE